MQGQEPHQDSSAALSKLRLTLSRKNLGILLQITHWAIFAVALLAPTLSQFTDLHPPLFPGLGVLASLVFVGVTVWANSLAGSALITASESRKPLLTIIFPLIFSVVLLGGYIVSFKYTTIAPPVQRTDLERRQIGFAMATWSLTTRAREYATEHPDSQPDDLMMAFGAWGTPDGETQIWTWASYLGAGMLNISLFFGGFGAVAFALAALRQHARIVDLAELV